MADEITVVLATSNQGKLLELRELFAGLPIQLVSSRQVLGPDFSVVEDGATFEANAILKATAVCRASGLVALADDSGLEVDALGGRPGVRSARFAHERATDAENNAALLRALAGESSPAARFRCVLALASPWRSRVITAEGTCEGRITLEPRGTGGFGYDPLFLVDDHPGRTMAELGEAEKNRISHRARAAAALRPHLAELLSEQVRRAEEILG